MADRRRRLDRWGFRAWMIGTLLFTVGLTQGIRLAWVVGLLLLVALLLGVVVRTARDVWWPRRVPSGDRADKR